MSKIVNDLNKVNELLDSRYLEAVFPSEEKAREILMSGKRLSFYLGIDPTGPEIHLGHTIPLLLLKQFAKLGHETILLIGDFTAMIGDPTDKEATRKALTRSEVKNNMKNYVKQVRKVLNGTDFSVKRNSKWLSRMSFENIIKLVSQVTVQQMITRDMFQERIQKQKPIFLHEFLYPLMQGYDSVAMKVDGEVGGNDQTFNMLVGRDLERSYLNKEKLVFTTKLLANPETGKKISKTQGIFIAVNDSPDEIFYNLMHNVPDIMVRIIFELATEKPLDWITERQNKINAGENPKNFKEELAYELVKMYHGQEEAEKTRENFRQIYYQEKLPEEVKKISADGQTIVQALVAIGIAPSRSEAKRLVDQGAVRINGQIENRWDRELKTGDIIRIGPKEFREVK